MEDDYSVEANRVKSFESFNMPVETFSIISSLGFYYTGRGLYVQCYYCSAILELENSEIFTDHQEIIKRHAKKIPQCPFAKPNPAGFLNFSSESNLDTLLRTGDFSHEATRLSTFLDWPRTSPIDSKELAARGFVYIGPIHTDRVKCIYCLLILKHWCSGDNVREEHSRHGADCPLVIFGFDEKETLKHYKPKMGINPITAAEVFEIEEQSQLQNITSSEIGFSNEKPVDPQMRFFQTRHETFRRWKIPEIKTKDLAEAGFYYLENTFDMVKCFWCGLTLFRWESKDKPIEEHLKYRRDCKYLQDSLNQQVATQMGNISLSEYNLPDTDSDYPKEKMDTEIEQDICKICLNAKKNTLFLPCRHIVACSMCSNTIISTESPTCSVCRRGIKGTILVFL